MKLVTSFLAVLLSLAVPTDFKSLEASDQVGIPIPDVELKAQIKPLEAKEIATLAVVHVAPKTQPIAPAVQPAGDCKDWMTQAGISHTAASDKLILNESGCRTWAVNPKSGACGIPQAYPCSKLKCPLDNSGGVCQLKWMQQYVTERYGTWEKALAFWYAQCPTKKGCWY